MRVAFLGGSFDPPHMGHLFLAVAALSSQAVERVLVVPCFAHPLGAKSPVAFEHRMEMARLAFMPLESMVEVSDIESRLESPSRTFNTLVELKRRNPHWSLRLLVGADIPQQRSSWYRIDDVEAMAPPLVFGRGGVDSPETGLVLPEVSSSDVRRRLRDGLPLMNLVPLSVEQYVNEHGLYRE